MAINMDLEKAYDMLNWDSIRFVLINFLFKMCNLIMKCITSKSFPILINGLNMAVFTLRDESDKVILDHHIYLFVYLTSPPFGYKVSNLALANDCL